MAGAMAPSCRLRVPVRESPMQMRHLSDHCRSAMPCLLAAALALAGCHGRQAPPAAGTAASATDTAPTSNDRSGALSSDLPAATAPLTADVLAGSKWPPAQLTSGSATISCDTDYAATGDGWPLLDLGYFSVLDAMAPCRDSGVVRLHYRGRIASDFTALVQRVAAMAERMDIDKRILDIDSPGGQVEDGIRAGDAIGGSHWTIWVREGSACHSACVLILAAGDRRVISGPVGIHRIIRMSSTATTRAELSQELQAVRERIKDYLARNGADVTVADMMMTVPSSALRLLTPGELAQYGLSGSNPAQQDLERIRLLRKCGEDFVHRREAFERQYARECDLEVADVDARNACGLELRQRYGFPGDRCTDESPLAELD